jgi:hypothetical protein
MAAELHAGNEDQPSLLFLTVDAVTFWARNPLLFWIVALPIAGLAAALAYLLDAHQALAPFRDHWGWNLLFAIIYALFLDRWIKASLLDGASPCDEVDNLRRSVVSLRFLAFAASLFLSAYAMASLAAADAELSVVVWSAGAALFALYLPALSAAEPLSLRHAFAAGRALQVHLFLLIAGCVAVSLLAGLGVERAAALYFADRPWTPAAVAAAHRIVDCLLLAVVGHALAAAFCQVTDWRPPEPDDHPYRGMGLKRRNIPGR